MGAILDLVGSYVFKAAMIGIILSTSISLNGVMVEKSQLNNLEKTINVAMSVVEWDVKNIGYNYSPVTSAITMAYWYDLRFYADTDNDGSPDYVRWYLVSRLLFTNGLWVIRYDLVRTVNGVGNTVMNRIISWRFDYYDANGVATATLSNIRRIKVSVAAESPVSMPGTSLIARREFTIFPANLSPSL